ncbi:MAG: FHA domain-containing protein, partial [Bacteroidota bacterium]
NNGIVTVGWYDKHNPNANTVGIKEENTSYISRRHATIERIEGQNVWIIKDGQFWTRNGITAWHRSTNGTYVDSQEADKHGIQFLPGNIITLGDTTLRVVTKKRRRS